MEPRIYRGTLRHRRFLPIPHAFTYPIFMVLLDIDRIPETMGLSRFSSYNRWNWAAFDDRDHFGDPHRPLRARLAADAEDNGLTLPDGRIYLLTHLRYLGYAFNPVSFFYCYDAEGQLCTILAEVNNTYGGRQNYWLTQSTVDSRRSTVDSEQAPVRRGVRLQPDHPPHQSRVRRYRRPKAMYVSPFMSMNQTYTFALTEPGKRLVAHMTVEEEGATKLDATLTLSGAPWTAGTLSRALVAHPWMTARVIGAIHWEALKLYLRGVPVVARPPDSAPEVAGRRVLG